MSAHLVSCFALRNTGLPKKNSGRCAGSLSALLGSVCRACCPGRRWPTASRGLGQRRCQPAGPQRLLRGARVLLPAAGGRKTSSAGAGAARRRRGSFAGASRVREMAKVGSKIPCESRASSPLPLRDCALPSASPASPLPPGEFMAEFTAALRLADRLENAFAAGQLQEGLLEAGGCVASPPGQPGPGPVRGRSPGCLLCLPGRLGGPASAPIPGLPGRRGSCGAARQGEIELAAGSPGGRGPEVPRLLRGIWLLEQARWR